MKQQHQIEWKGHKLDVTGYTDGYSSELTSIEGISVLTALFECEGNGLEEIEKLFAEAELKEQEEKEAGTYHSSCD